MALRTVCLCEGEYIGIESIFTVIDGEQINIKEKVEELREKSRRKQLFCPCECGANLMLIASDRKKKEQHFRLYSGEQSTKCQVEMEGKRSIYSKIVLKCWLDDKLRDEKLEKRVSISTLSDTNRKYELSFLSRTKGVAVNYCRDRANLSKEKLDVLEEYCKGLRIIHVADIENEAVTGQYPEGVMKVQDKQGYCLFLHIEENEYEKAIMSAVYYYKDAYGLWDKVIFAKGLLSEYEFDIQGELCFHYKRLSVRAEETAEACNRKIEAAKKRIEEEQKRREAEQKRILEEQEKKRQEQRQREAEAERQRLAREEQKRLDAERLKEEEKKKEEEFWKSFPERILQQDVPVIDPKGNRWYRCQCCGKDGKEGMFSSRGGNSGSMNLGLCRACEREGKKKPIIPEIKKSEKPKADLQKCPFCGAKLVVRYIRKDGSNSYRCSDFPKCDFSDDY